MKRFNKSAIAVAMAVTLTLGIAPVAGAQDIVLGGNEGDNGERTAWVDPTLPPQPLPEGLTEQPGPTSTVDSLVDPNGNRYPADPALATNIAELEKSNAVASTGVSPAKNAVCVENGVTVSYLRHADGLNYVKAGNPTTGALPGAAGAYRSYADINADQNCALVDGGQVQGAVTPGEVTTDPADIAKAVAAVVGAGVGAAIIINGVKYFLNKDGKTLVETPERVHMDATPEEKAKSEQLIKENAGQINNANNAQNERGIAAATGVNKIPAALMTLLLASVLAAAAFVFGRRQLV